MKYVETRILSRDNLRSLCVKNKWYTRGSNEEYEKLFSRLTDECGCPKNLTADMLYEIAEDIMEHSNITDYTISAVMLELSRVSYYFFEESKKEDSVQQRIENLKEALKWKEGECEKMRQALIKRVSELSANAIAHGYIDGDISDIRRCVEETNSLRDQIALLELLQKDNA